MNAGLGSRRPEQAGTIRADLDPASDAAIMLRVAAGDEESFNYLAGSITADDSLPIPDGA